MQHTVYIGTYTHSGGKGICRATLSNEGVPNLIDVAEATSPSYLILSSEKKYVYAANEAREVDGIQGGAITAFSVEADGSLKKVVTRSTGGGSPCHILEQGGYLFSADYDTGSITAFPLVNGVPGEAEFTHFHEGSGPDKGRQESPHAHCVMAVPEISASGSANAGSVGSADASAKVFCAIDLGIDQAKFYRRDDHALTLVQALPFPGGSGPRHVVFSQCGRYGWVVTELSNEIYILRHDDNSKWAIINTISTLPPDYTGRSACAAIRLSRDGKLIAVSNRFHDSVAIFEIDAATGLLALLGIYPCGGANPRDIAFSPDDKWLLSANQDSDSVTVLSVEHGFKVVGCIADGISKPTSILFG